MKRSGPLQRRSPMSRGSGFRSMSYMDPEARRDKGLDAAPVAIAVPRPAPLAQRRGVYGPVDALVRAAPKSPHEVNKQLLELARGQRCLLCCVPGCEGSGGTTVVACHENRLSAAKGGGYKAHDWRSVWGCYLCHHELDFGGHRFDVVDAWFEAAWRRQVLAWREISENRSERPWKRAAAAWALERARAHNLLEVP